VLFNNNGQQRAVFAMLSDNTAAILPNFAVQPHVRFIGTANSTFSGNARHQKVETAGT